MVQRVAFTMVLDELKRCRVDGEPLLLGAFALKNTEANYWSTHSKVFSTTMCGGAEQKNPVAHLLTIFNKTIKIDES